MTKNDLIRINEIKTRVNEATREPWYLIEDRTINALPGFYPITIANTSDGNRGIADARFIVFSRSDIPFLLSIIKKQELEINKLKLLKNMD